LPPCPDFASNFNIGNPGEFSIEELASLVVELAGTHSRIVLKARPTDDPRQRQPDISKAHEILSRARTQLKDGLICKVHISTSSCPTKVFAQQIFGLSRRSSAVLIAAVI
jgi:hypothetical protein